MIKKGQVPKLLMYYLAGLIFIVCSEVYAGINDGLIAYYPFNEYAYDWSGMENHGTIYGAVPTNDRFGNADKAYSFDGSGDYINIPRTTNLEPPNQIAISLWFKANKTAGTIHRIINKMHGYQSHTVTAYIENDKLLVWVQGTSTIWYHPRVDPFTDISSWHHLCFSYDGSETKLYLDNVLVDSHVMSGPIQYDEHDWTIGAYDGGQQSFNGLIDDVRIYNRPLSADEVQQLYYELAGYWKFDGDATDSSGNGNNGSLSGDPSYADGVCAAAIDFDGIDDDLSVPNSPSLNPTKGVTIAVWMKSVETEQNYLVFKHRQYGLTGLQAHRLAFGVYLNGTQEVVSSNTNVFDDIWHFLAGTWDGDTGVMKLYIDGVEVSSNNATGNLDTGSYDLRMASGLEGQCHDMTLDEVHFYSRALSQSEIQSLMNECDLQITTTTSQPTTTTSEPTTTTTTSVEPTTTTSQPTTTTSVVSTTTTTSIPCTVNAQCDDGLFCNGMETCIAGNCGNGTPVNCNDGVACTDDSCNEETDSCNNIPNNARCDDGNACTIDICDGSQCIHESNPETIVCRPATGPCDVEERCTGTSPDCPTDDHAPNGISCNDGLYCSSDDECLDGVCTGSSDTCPGQGCNELTDECSTLGALINTPPDGTIIHYGESIDFTGCGTPEGTEVGDYSWRLGDPETGFELSSNKNFSTNLLQVGPHAIYFKVKDLYEDLWSAPDSVTVTVEEALGLPDLALSRSDITFFNASGQEIQEAADGEPVTIQAKIHNISINDTQSPVTVNVYDGDAVNGILIGSDTIEEVIAGDPQGRDETAKIAAINWTATGDTYKVITVKIEYGYPEATLQNNQASRLVIVGDPSGTFTMTVEGSVSKSSPCYGDTITVSGTAAYEWLGIPVMGAEVTVEVWEYAENGQFYSTVQGKTTAPYGNYCISLNAPSQNIEYVITTRVNDGFLTGTDTNDIIQPDPCVQYDLSCSAPSLDGNVFYIPCPGFSNTKTYTNSLVAVSGQITNSGNQDFLNPDGFDVEFRSGYPFTPENLICSQRIDEVTYPEIAVGQSIPVSCPEGWTPSTAGTYNIYMKLFVNDQNSNNNQRSKPIQVYAERVDLRPYDYAGCSRVTGISFSKQCIVTGDEVTITCNIYNGGIDSSGPFEVRFYSGDPDGCCGQQIGSPVNVPSVPAGGYAQPQVQWDTSLFEGDEEIFVKVDIPDAVSEYDENNNKISARCYVHPTTADLYVGSVTLSNYAPNPGDFININARIDNYGGSISGPTDVDFYVGDPDGSGVHIGEPVSVAGIGPCGNATVTLPNWEVPLVGSHYIYAKLYSNGRKNFGVLQVYPDPQPDLSIYSEDILISSGPHILGNPIDFSATVHNQSAAAAATNPRVYFYIGGIPDPLDIAIVSSIPASASTPVLCNNAWIPAIEGFYEVGVELEPAFPQSDVNYANNWATTSFCVSTTQDLDADSALGICDNCPDQPNGQLFGTCVKSAGSLPFEILVGVGAHLTTCASDTACNVQVGESCELSQGDSNNNGIGDACECYADVNCSTKVDLADLVIMKAEFLRTDCATNPCNADCNGDYQVNLTDLVVMKMQFLRTNCPACP